MSERDLVFAGALPEIYDAYLVPLIFEPYAADIARRAIEADAHSILETAAGTGVVARALTPLLSAKARYVVTDLNSPMLARAASRQAPDPRITWQQADALHLPFEDSAFDLVCCQFGAMFFPDRIAGYREARRVLKPGGRFLFNVWDRIEENEFARVITDALASLYPETPPLFLARTPHGYHDAARIEADLRSAGFSDVELQTVAQTSIAESPSHPAIAYCQGTPLRNEIEARGAPGLDAATERVADAMRQAHGNGPVSGKIQAHVVVARV
jgi:ubiquinone/menaquinone biosynthesis C-methylase UbiE